MRSTAVAAVALTLALTGCGDGTPSPLDKRPPPARVTPGLRGATPAEPLDDAVHRIDAVAGTDDCRALLALFHPDVGAPPAATCAGTLKTLKAAKVVDTQRFDSAAVVRMGLPRRQQLELITALDADGHFRLVSIGGLAPLQVAPSEESDRYAAGAIGAIRAGSCTNLAAYFARYEPGAATPAQICALRNIRFMRGQLKPDDRQRIGRLGGDGAAAFYALRIAGRGIYTVILLANTPGDYRFAYAVRSG